MTFKDPGDHAKIKQGDEIVFKGIRTRIQAGDREIPVCINGHEIMALLDVSHQQRQHLLAGGILNFERQSLDTSPGEKTARIASKRCASHRPS
nr:hypothetical protein [Geothermobacter ehrlichii]